MFINSCTNHVKAINVEVFTWYTFSSSPCFIEYFPWVYCAIHEMLDAGTCNSYRPAQYRINQSVDEKDYQRKLSMIIGFDVLCAANAAHICNQLLIQKTLHYILLMLYYIHVSVRIGL